jgi:hypothetical protein
MIENIALALRQNLLVVAKAYAKATKASMSQISYKFYGNATFFEQFKAGPPPDGRSISIDKMQEMLEAFDVEWPEGAEWPMLKACSIERR